VTAFDPSALIVERWHDADRVVIAFNFARSANGLLLSTVPGVWRKLLASADSEWGGSGTETPGILDSKSPVTLAVPPTSFIVFRLDGGSQ
jgi:maltooligosyltrehalose trehalohydrolase